MKKKILMISLLFFIFMSGDVLAESLNGSFDGNPIVVLKSDGQVVAVDDVPAMIYKGRTLVPIYLLKKLGIGVSWDQNTYSINANIPKQTINPNDIESIINTLGKNIVKKIDFSIEEDLTKVLSVYTPIDTSAEKDNVSYGKILNAFSLTNSDKLIMIQDNGVTFSIRKQDLIDYRSGKITSIEFNNRMIIAFKDTRKPLTVSEISKLTNRVGIIYTYDRFNKAIAQGSGFMLYSNGMMITNHHVIYGSAYDTVKVNGQTFTSHWYAFDNQTTDLYGIAFNLDDQGKYKTDITFPFFRLNTKLPQVGDKVFAIGSPRELENTVSEGIVSGIRTINGMTMIQHTANTDHGSSGGVLLDSYGDVIGVTSAGFDGTSLDFAIPASYVQQELDKLK